MLGSVLADFFAPRFDWVQVEVTTDCQAACSYCPHTAYRDNWVSGYLRVDTFRRALPDLKKARLVHLQGWGEPFLHPEFFTLVSLARQAGCRVGTTTNGMLLDAASLRRLVDLEVGVVAFSLAGVGAHNDAVRRGTRFSEVLEKIRLLGEIKARKGAAAPKVHVAYMLLRSGLSDLPLLPRTLAGLGVGQVVISTLDFVARPGLAPESLRNLTPEECRDVSARLGDLADRGRRQGLEIHSQFPQPAVGRLTCPENPARAAVVSVDGAIAPCVFLNLPVQKVTCLNREGEIPYSRLSFGNLEDEPLPRIWRSRAYRDFRRAWGRGTPPSVCQGCFKPC